MRTNSAKRSCMEDILDYQHTSSTWSVDLSRKPMVVGFDFILQSSPLCNFTGYAQVNFTPPVLAFWDDDQLIFVGPEVEFRCTADGPDQYAYGYFMRSNGLAGQYIGGQVFPQPVLMSKLGKTLRIIPTLSIQMALQGGMKYLDT